jgi:ABC-2 type transport system permease protein
MATPETRLLRPPSSLREDAELFAALVHRELRSRYRGSYLGWIWALARPLVMLLIYGLVVGVFLGAAASIPEFMVFIFVGLLAWNLFSSIVTGSIGSLQASSSLISKHRFRTALIPTASVAVALVDTAIQGIVLLLGYTIVGDWPSPDSLVFLAPSLLGVILFGLALGLLLAALNIYARDVGFLTDVGLQVGFWLCPILYSYGFIVRAAENYGLSVEWVTRIYMLNPMANGVLGFQRALWPPASTAEGALFSFPGQLGWRLGIFLLFSIVSVVLSLRIFKSLSRNFAQEL